MAGAGAAGALFAALGSVFTLVSVFVTGPAGFLPAGAGGALAAALGGVCLAGGSLRGAK